MEHVVTMIAIVMLGVRLQGEQPVTFSRAPKGVPGRQCSGLQCL